MWFCLASVVGCGGAYREADEAEPTASQAEALAQPGALRSEDGNQDRAAAPRGEERRPNDEDAAVSPPPAFEGAPGAEAEVCTLLGCESGFRVQLDKEGPWVPGVYELRVRGERVAACEVVMGADDPDVQCDEGLRLVLSGARSPSPLELHVDFVADAVTLEAVHDGTLLAVEEYRPTWRTVRPNGPACAPACTVADATRLAFE